MPTNLIEGGQRDGTREHRRFVSIALGSAAETHYLLTVAFRLQVMPAAGGLISDYEGLLPRSAEAPREHPQPP